MSSFSVAEQGFSAFSKRMREILPHSTDEAVRNRYNSSSGPFYGWGAHAECVAWVAKKIAKLLGYSTEERRELAKACSWHDDGHILQRVTLEEIEDLENTAHWTPQRFWDDIYKLRRRDSRKDNFPVPFGTDPKTGELTYFSDWQDTLWQISQDGESFAYFPAQAPIMHGWIGYLKHKYYGNELAALIAIGHPFAATEWITDNPWYFVPDKGRDESQTFLLDVLASKIGGEQKWAEMLKLAIFCDSLGYGWDFCGFMTPEERFSEPSVTVKKWSRYNKPLSSSLLDNVRAVDKIGKEICKRLNCDDLYSRLSSEFPKWDEGRQSFARCIGRNN